MKYANELNQMDSQTKFSTHKSAPVKIKNRNVAQMILKLKLSRTDNNPDV